MYWLPIHQSILKFFLYWSVHQSTNPKSNLILNFREMKCRNFQKVCSLLLHRNEALIEFNHKLFFKTFIFHAEREIWISKSNWRKIAIWSKKNYKNVLVDWFGRKNVTITISIHCQKSNGYPIHYWTGWTDWIDQSKLGLVTHTLFIVYLSLFPSTYTCTVIWLFPFPLL